MNVFVTGATGWVGTAVVFELLASGYSVTGLTTSAKGAKALVAMGAKACVGKLTDLPLLGEQAAKSDGVIHTAFIHDLAHMSIGMRLRVFAGALNGGIVASFMRILGETETNAVRALGAGLRGSGKPFVVTSGVVNLPLGRVSTEEDTHATMPNRSFSERAAFDFVSHGVRSCAIRLAPSVHGAGDRGFIHAIVEAARKRGVSPYVGGGDNRWAAVHRLDAATLFRLALEKGAAGATYHGVGETGIPFKEIASLVGRGTSASVRSIDAKDAARHFGMIASFIALDNPSSSEWTQQALGWRPNQPGLLADMKQHYFRS